MHLMIDGVAKNRELLTDVKGAEKWLLELALYAGMMVVGEPKVYQTSYPLRPPAKDSGLSGTVFLGESSITLHTWPEADWVNLDIFTCRDDRDPDVLIAWVRATLGLRNFQAFYFERGVDVENNEPLRTRLGWIRDYDASTAIRSHKG